MGGPMSMPENGTWNMANGYIFQPPRGRNFCSGSSGRRRHAGRGSADIDRAGLGDTPYRRVALNLGTLVYIFKSLKSEVKDVGQKVSQLDTIRFKLVHKDDCRHALDRVHERIDSLEERVLLMEGRHPEHRHDSQD